MKNNDKNLAIVCKNLTVVKENKTSHLTSLLMVEISNGLDRLSPTKKRKKNIIYK